MIDATADPTRLLDAACASESAAVRECAVRRVCALRFAERTRMHGRLAASEADTPVVRSTGRAQSAEVESLLRNLEAFGIPAPQAAPYSDAVERLLRELVALEVGALGRAVDDLGRLQIALLCRDLDRASASRLLRRVDGELATVGALARVVPARDEALLRDTCRRLAAAGAVTGLDLVRALGRGLLERLLSGAGPDTAAVLARRTGLALGPPDPAAPAWVCAAASLLGERTCG
jgi:hypothetical protein